MLGSCRVAMAVGLLVTLLSAVPSAACPFCPTAGQTLTQEVNQANLIIFGTLSNAKRDPEEFGKGTTEMTIEVVVKEHEIVKGQTKITLPRYVPADPKNPSKYLVFCDVLKGKLDPYRGEAVALDSKIAEYLKGAIVVRDKNAATRLKFFFNYLDSSESAISLDAFMEFAAADYAEIASIAPKLPADKIVKWLRDPNTSAARFGFLGSLLGYCGNAKEHGPLLREMLLDPKKKFSSGMDGMMAAYVMLDPKEGWEFIRSVLADEKKEFLERYAALRAVRYFQDYRRDAEITHEQVVDAMQLLLSQGDIADLPIDDLRRWGCWEMTDKVLSLYSEKSHSIPIVKRAIVRFALSAQYAQPDNAKAAAFLKQRRAEDPDRVKEIEQLLELERTPPKPAPKTGDAKK
jgi:hypothetical protein